MSEKEEQGQSRARALLTKQQSFSLQSLPLALLRSCDSHSQIRLSLSWLTISSYSCSMNQHTGHRLWGTPKHANPVFWETLPTTSKIELQVWDVSDVCAAFSWGTEGERERRGAYKRSSVTCSLHWNPRTDRSLVDRTFIKATRPWIIPNPISVCYVGPCCRPLLHKGLPRGNGSLCTIESLLIWDI